MRHCTGELSGLADALTLDRYSRRTVGWKVLDSDSSDDAAQRGGIAGRRRDRNHPQAVALLPPHSARSEPNCDGDRVTCC